jgi:hypothetical protein
MNNDLDVTASLDGAVEKLGLRPLKTSDDAARLAAYSLAMDGAAGKLKLARGVVDEISRLATFEAVASCDGNPVVADALARLDVRGLAWTVAAFGGAAMRPCGPRERPTMQVFAPPRFFPLREDETGELSEAALAWPVEGGAEVETHAFASGTLTIETKRVTRKGEVVFEGRKAITDASRIWVEWARYPGRDPGAGLFPPSSFDRALGLLKDAEDQYERVIWEMSATEAAVLVGPHALDDTGRALPERDRRLYRTLNLRPDINADLFSVYSPEIRVSAQAEALELILARIEWNCDLSAGAISGVLAKTDGIPATATEIIMQKQRSFAAVTAFQRELDRAIKGAARSLWEYVAAAGGDSSPYEIGVEWGDGVMTDREADRARALLEVNAGIISKRYYLTEYYGMTPEEADAATGGAVSGADEIDRLLGPLTGGA